MKLLKFGMVVSVFMVFFSSFASEPFNNKFTSWWTWKPNEKCGEIQITKPTLETPQGYLSFVPESGKHGIQAYTHIKVDNQKCYQLTLKFKSTVDINKSAKIQFYIKGKNKNKSWQSLKPFLCKKISIEPGKTQTVSIIANLHEMKSDDVTFLVPHVEVSNLKKGVVKLESLKCVSIKPPAKVKESGNGLVLHYDFSEAGGNLLYDKSGKGNTGQIVGGAKFVKFGRGHALHFDGNDDYVDCGNSNSVDIKKDISIDLWVNPDGDNSGGGSFAGIVGKSFGSYFLSHRCNEYLYFNISSGGNGTKITIPNKRWSHIVVTFDGSFLRIYKNAKLIREIPSKIKAINSDGKLYLGKTGAESRWTNNARYKGFIANLKIFTRAISEDEIQKSFNAGKKLFLSDNLTLKPYMFYGSKELIVEVNKSSLVNQDSAESIEAILTGPDSFNQQKTLSIDASKEVQNIVFKLNKMRPGKYTVKVQLKSTKRKFTPIVSTIEIKKPQKWKDNPNLNVKNNFVTELLIKSNVTLDKKESFNFENPREGWVYFGIEPADKDVEFTLTDKRLSCKFDRINARLHESMQYLTKGSNMVTIEASKKVSVDKVLIRTMPEIILMENQDMVVEAFPLIHREFNATLENFMRHYNKDRLATEDISSKKAWLDAWRKKGRKAFCHTMASGPSGHSDTGVSYSDTFKLWSNSAGMQYLDGIFIDEFGYGTKKAYPFWIDAVERITNDKKYHNKTIYGYTAGSSWISTVMAKDFQKEIYKTGNCFAPEIYIGECANEIADKKRLVSELSDNIKIWEKQLPGSIKNIIVVLGCCSKNTYIMNTYPDVDYKVHYDMQMNLLANDPAFRKVKGVSSWVSRYADAETLRWMNKLYRHYCIEGKTNLLSEEYGYTYKLDHIKNSEFKKGLENWTIEDGSGITTAKLPEYKKMQNFWHNTSSDYFALYNKKTEKPHVLTQKIIKLIPGELYSVKIITGDFSDIGIGESKKKKHDVFIDVGNAEIIDSKTEDIIFPGYSYPPFKNGDKPWFQWHYRVFRAKGKTAKLEIGDWKSRNAPGNNQDQKLMVNFVEVQPYFASALEETKGIK